MKLFDVYPLYDITPVKGNGVYVYDEHGNQYLDFYGGHAVISVGHAHPHYIDRITQQLKQLGFYSNAVQNPLQKELADKLGKISGCEDYQLFLCNSGAEANENALKLASFHTGKKKVIAFEKAFHGRTSAAVAATDNKKIQAPINSGHPVTHLPWEDLEALEEELAKGETCAVIIEPIQGVGGLQTASNNFLKGIRELCTRYSAFFIADEIQSGYGRSGKFFAFQFAGVNPDMITIAKGMGNGFPMAGVLIHEQIAPQHGQLGTTFGGNHLACAAGLAVLEIIEKEDLVKKASTMGEFLKKEMESLQGVNNVKGKGLMCGITLDQQTAPFRKQLLFEEKIFTGGSANPQMIRLLPPLTIGKDQIEQLAAGLQKVLTRTHTTKMANL
ncbi:aminotransferase class III-fold pyridoxal phosphate-dependent enzyme [Robertkochia marina]|uniref:Aminotransferase class III-fold pyridoxal phosphate-dependent enzyme n=1 Tax=Robertkochia marina TaxID=1227945 RepID=A0A4S3LZV4_9FLAO|nr:aminotransferase class III-fold pyridoxal phosphate-dependent enzyme [Robertkochia marina]THD67662.1 aminotransferase class III-fold pyridoxal phosphate-dependent enzyme [Robertkochia marina]TRZ43394.1 aminotransferase class III-fold pyridoxal phosphate-dependent enzyme [Robertkochia marina]